MVCRVRGRSAASPQTHSVSAFPARADSADETYVSIRLLPASLCRVRVNPFILCPGGLNDSSAAQIELERANLELARRSKMRFEQRALGQDGRRWRGVSAEERCLFGALSRAPGERWWMHLDSTQRLRHVGQGRRLRVQHEDAGQDGGPLVVQQARVPVPDRAGVRAAARTY